MINGNGYGSQESLAFTDLFDLSEIQKLQDAFSAATGVASVITDPAGTPLTVPSNFCSLCNDVIRKTAKGLANCRISDAKLGRSNPEGSSMQPCLSSGLMDGGASIMVDGRHVANWLVGQIVTEDTSEETLLAYADQIGADKERYRAELQKVTRMSRERFKEICDFLFINAQLLSKYAYRTQRLSVEMGLRALAEAQLREMNSSLQGKVAERARDLEELNCELEELNAILEEEVTERERSEALVRELNQELESRVEERTKALLASEKLYSATFQQSPSAIELYDHKGALIRVNEACFKMFGVEDPRDIAGQNLFSNPNLDAEVKARVRNQESVRFESDFDFSQAGYKTRNRGHRVFSWCITPLIQEGVTTGYIVQIMDLTEQKSAHDEILKAKEAAEAANLTQAQFLANMSHEIRTPMNGIMGFTDLALMTPFDMEQQDYLTTIKTSTQSLLRVVNDILDYSKIGAGKMSLKCQPFEIRKTVSEVADLFSISAQQKKLNLDIVVDDRIPEAMMGDPVRLKQVLSNLVGNAVKFTHSGEIVIGAELHHVSETDFEMGFRVTDTGIGIAEAEVENLFQGFYQAESSHTRNYGGTGLGLAISKDLVTMMQGEIGVESTLGKGSTFKFSAKFSPLDDMAFDDKPGAESRSALAGASSSKHILLVEDDEISQKLERRLLEKMGYQVTLACDGEIAVLKAAESPYDLIFMDINMPRMDGFTATREIRKIQAVPVPIVALTAQAIGGDWERCIASGMDDYLTKPVNVLELTYILNKYLKG